MTKRLFRLKTDDTALINWLKSKPEFQSFAIDLFNKVRTGKLVPVEDVINSQELDEKIKQQKYLELCLKNWKALKENGNIFEEAKEIILGERQLQAPQLQSLIQSEPQLEVTEGLTELSYCTSCKHQHYGDEPRKCKNSFCNCGVRG